VNIAITRAACSYDDHSRFVHPCVFPESRYTGKERDTESGNDYFGARYYASTMGRWTSPDPTQLWYADPTNPQSLNLYGYGWNNPHKYIDKDGNEVVLALVGAGVGFATGFVGEWIHDDLSGKGFSWRDSLSYGAGGAATGALAGLTFGGSLLFQAAAGVTVSTLGSAGGGVISRSLAGEDAFDADSVRTDLEVGFAGGVLGESVGGAWKVINAKAIPKAPTPFGNVANNIRRLEKINAWRAAQNQIENQSSATSSVLGSLYSNVGVQAYTGWNSSNIQGWNEFDYLDLVNRSGCARTMTDDTGNPNGQGSIEVSGCQ
jgi:RHS repeat-associated protein